MQTKNRSSDWMDEDERKIDAVYAGKIRSRYVDEIPPYRGARSRFYLSMVYRCDSGRGAVHSRMGDGHLHLFQSIFQKCDEAVRGEPGISFPDV